MSICEERLEKYRELISRIARWHELPVIDFAWANEEDRLRFELDSIIEQARMLEEWDDE